MSGKASVKAYFEEAYPRVMNATEVWTRFPSYSPKSIVLYISMLTTAGHLERVSKGHYRAKMTAGTAAVPQPVPLQPAEEKLNPISDSLWEHLLSVNRGDVLKQEFLEQYEETPWIMTALTRIGQVHYLGSGSFIVRQKLQDEDRKPLDQMGRILYQPLGAGMIWRDDEETLL